MLAELVVDRERYNFVAVLLNGRKDIAAYLKYGVRQQSNNLKLQKISFALNPTREALCRISEDLRA